MEVEHNFPLLNPRLYIATFFQKIGCEMGEEELIYSGNKSDKHYFSQMIMNNCDFLVIECTCM